MGRLTANTGFLLNHQRGGGRLVRTWKHFTSLMTSQPPPKHTSTHTHTHTRMSEVWRDWPPHLWPLATLTPLKEAPSPSFCLSVWPRPDSVSVSPQIWTSAGWSHGLANTGAWTLTGVTSATVSTGTCCCLTEPVEVSPSPPLTYAQVALALFDLSSLKRDDSSPALHLPFFSAYFC